MSMETPAKPGGGIEERSDEPKGGAPEKVETAHGGGSGSAVAELRTKLVELEYEYLVQSSLHSDGLRNQIIQFYLIIASAAASAILGLAKIQAESTQAGQTQPMVATWVFSVIAGFIGVIGVVMLPIFVRLRRVVLECLQGTVLLKRYAVQVVSKSGDQDFESSMLWDGHSLPTDERYLTASFILIFVVILLDSSMLAISSLLLLSERLPYQAAGLWSLAFGTAILTVQVVVYRWLLWHEIRNAMESDKLRVKWSKLMTGQGDPKLEGPALRNPLIGALLVGGIATVVIAYFAWQWEPLRRVLGL